ncbi:hypothetical protein JW906_15510 [bacterium]|nr:hypothetical protein [bacterium]
MNVNKLRLVTISVFILFSCNKNQNSIDKIGNLTIVHLHGTPYQRGYDYGHMLKHEIRDIVEIWKQEVETTFSQDFNTIIQHFFQSTSYVATAEKYMPDLLKEIRGIAEGCGIDYNTILALQMSEEIDAHSDDSMANKCTSISINKTDSTSTFLAQNMDPPLYFHGKPTLLHLTDPDNKSEKFVFTFPGLVGLCGLNSNSVGVACNGISMLNHTHTGLPVAFILRMLLEQENEQSAYNCIEKLPIAIPQCYTIGGIQTARCYECSAHDKKVFYPFEEKSITIHTNFSISNRDFNSKYIELLKEYGKTVDDPYYCPRYFNVYDKMVAFDFQLNFEKIKQILSSTDSDLEPISNENTFGSLIMELSENPILYISPGKPDKTKFITLKF